MRLAGKWDLGRNVKWIGFKWVFLVVLLVHGFAVFFFTRGFLLTRSELSLYSQCDDVYGSPCFPPPRDQNTSQVYWAKPGVDRLVIIVLDALRFDFVAPSTFFAEKRQWMDKLEVLLDHASRNGSAAKIFKAFSDPPTTSLQRLKGLTTGGLPTFIDVGNSFGAPEIVEDSWIQQLAQNGKRVVMMGDDTWVKLFPNHFIRSYPFPSFNVKDLHTVDDGCIQNLIPTLYKKDWDVLIAHFLGMDHVGHIFGVESFPMIDKLEQYNEIVKKVFAVLESQSGPGDLHENTMLLVMGDHGQTLNGDHGGGTAEEVETALFALSMKKRPIPQLPDADSSDCQLDAKRRRICIGSIQQLDFAATVSALVGIPFPFGSIGRVNLELFSLAGGSWNYEMDNIGFDQSASIVGKWLQDYANVLCINSWQVKRYIDAYSSMSLIGFSDKELLYVSDLYSKAHECWSTTKNFSFGMNQVSVDSSPSVQMLLDAFSLFLESVAKLARSSWTEFNLKLMGLGFCIMLVSFYMHLILIKKLEMLCEHGSWLSNYRMNLLGVNLASFMAIVRACSFLSNSYILEEGRVAIFLLATTCILQLRYAAMKKTRFLEGLLFCNLIILLRFSIELGQLKQAVNSLFLKVDPSQYPSIPLDSWLWMCITEVTQMLSLMILAYILFRSMGSYSSLGISKCIVVITLFNFFLILLFWASDNLIINLDPLLGSMKGNLIPRLTYSAGLLQVILLAVSRWGVTNISNSMEPAAKALALLSAGSSTIIILSGKQGSMILLALAIGGWCISRLSMVNSNKESSQHLLFYVLPVTQWSFLGVCMFFSSGHWCSFDGLRYAAAFVGFDEFHLIRQAILLTIDTFGFSLILPVFGLPLLVASSCYSKEKNQCIFIIRLSQVYLIYGLISAITTTFSMLCVTLHRRHLMVWGLFAPKFVFDVVALLLTDLIILLCAFFYFE